MVCEIQGACTVLCGRDDMKAHEIDECMRQRFGVDGAALYRLQSKCNRKDISRRPVVGALLLHLLLGHSFLRCDQLLGHTSAFKKGTGVVFVCHIANQ